MFDLFSSLDHPHAPFGAHDPHALAASFPGGEGTDHTGVDQAHVPQEQHHHGAVTDDGSPPSSDEELDRHSPAGNDPPAPGVHNPEDHLLMSAADFERDGQYDPVHHCNVVGNVASDMAFVHQQTNGSCSLMAQEQFVERYRGIRVSEAALEKLAGSWGVYTPEGGTTFPGQDAILDYYDVPHQRFTRASMDMLDGATRSGNDALISVDARHFYHDATIPPDSPHAVAVVGKGLDPSDGTTRGYYFTDSNTPGHARYLTLDELYHCWYGDMITVPGDVALDSRGTQP